MCGAWIHYRELKLTGIFLLQILDLVMQSPQYFGVLILHERNGALGVLQFQLDPCVGQHFLTPTHSSRRQVHFRTVIKTAAY